MILAVVLCLGVVAALALPWWRDMVDPPQDVVIQALEAAGHADTAEFSSAFGARQLDVLAPSTTDEDIFAAPQRIRIQDVDEVSLVNATVQVSYMVGTTPMSDSVAVSRDTLFSRWQLDGEPPILEVTAPHEVAISIAETEAALGKITAVPGAYRVQVDHPMFAAGTVTAIVGLDGGYQALKPKLRDSADEVAAKAVKKVIDQCAAQERLTLQSDCPFFNTRPQIVRPTSSDWSVESYPNLRVKADGGDFVVVTTAPGTAVLSLEYAKRNPEKVSCRFNVDGDLTMKGSKVSWEGNPITNLKSCDVKDGEE